MTAPPGKEKAKGALRAPLPALFFPVSQGPEKCTQTFPNCAGKYAYDIIAKNGTGDDNMFRKMLALLLSAFLICGTAFAGTEDDYAEGAEAYNAGDYAAAVEFFAHAAEQGHAASQYNLGMLYKNGRGVEQSFEQAAAWNEKAAAQGDFEAQYRLGKLYELGKGVEQSYEQAAAYYQLAADQQYPDALSALGVLFRNGTGVEQSDEKAMELLQAAAELGNQEAADWIEANKVPSGK